MSSVELWPVERLRPYENNPRDNDAAVDQIVGSIREFGFRIPILVTPDGEIIDGHLRLKGAERLGMTEVPVLVADGLTAAQIRAYRLAANRSVDWADWDPELVNLEVLDLRAADYDTALTGFTEEELATFETVCVIAEDGLTDEDELPDMPTGPVTVEGDLWQLGGHRIACRAPDQLEAYDALLGDETAGLLMTSIRPERAAGAVQDALTIALPRVAGAVYLSLPDTDLAAWVQAFRAAGGYFSTFIMDKRAQVASAEHYERAYRALLYGWPDGTRHYWCGARNQGDVWLDSPDTASGADLADPVETASQIITNSSKARDIVLDIYGDTGTTVIACERLRRRARVLETDPRRVDMAIRRWQAFTGKSAVLVGDGRTFDEVADERT